MSNDPSDLVAALPHLTIEDVQACFAFASEAVAAQYSIANPGFVAASRSR